MSETQTLDNNRPTWAIALALAWVIVFCFLFFRLDLPNNSDINRAELWLEMPDQLYFLFAQHPDATETSWGNFSQRIPLIATGLWILAGAWGFGSLVLRGLRIDSISSLERLFFASVLGLSCVSLLTLGCGLLAQKFPLAMSAGVLGTGLILACVAEVAFRLLGRNPADQGSAETSTFVLLL